MKSFLPTCLLFLCISLKITAQTSFITERFTTVISGVDNFDESYAVSTDAQGNSIIVGSFFGTCDFDPSVLTRNVTATGTGYNAFVAKYSATGALVWVKTLDGPGGANGVVCDAAGNVYFTGYYIDFLNTTAGNLTGITRDRDNIFFGKMDNAGNLVWIKNITSTNTVAASGEFITLDNQNNVILSGRYADSTDVNPSPLPADTNFLRPNFFKSTQGFIGKYISTNGNFLNVIPMETTSSFGGLFGPSQIIFDAQNNMFICGFYSEKIDLDGNYSDTSYATSSNSSGLYYAKYNSANVLQYVRTLRSGFNGAGAQGMQLDRAGNIYLSGSYSGVQDFDPSDAGVFELTSTNHSNIGGSFSRDIFLVKYNGLTGAFMFAKSMGSEGDDFLAYGLRKNSRNELCMAGYFNSQMPFMASQTAQVLSKGQNEIFYVQYDTLGNHVGSFSVGGTDDDYCYGLTIDRSDNVLFTGIFNGTSNFNPNIVPPSNRTVAGIFTDIYLSAVSVQPITVLSVNLLSFTAQKNTTNSNKLRWKISNSKNTKGTVTIQKSESDPLHFKEIGKKNMLPNDQPDEFIDNNITQSKNYYRLQIKDDQKTTFSDVILIENDQNNNWILTNAQLQYGKLVVNISDESTSSIQLKLADASGRIVWVNSIRTNASQNQIFNFDLYSLMAQDQMLYLIVEGNGKKISKGLIRH